MTYALGSHNSNCPHDKVAADTVTPLITTQPQKVRLVTTSGWWVDFEKTPEFNLVSFAVSIRSSGFLLNDRCYIPAEHIESVFIYDADKPPEQMGVVIPFSPRPGA
jgi:hypothetical protein